MTAERRERMEVQLDWRERIVQTVLAGVVLALLVWIGTEVNTLGKQMSAFDMWRHDTELRLEKMEMKR